MWANCEKKKAYTPQSAGLGFWTEPSLCFWEWPQGQAKQAGTLSSEGLKASLFLRHRHRLTSPPLSSPLPHIWKTKTKRPSSYLNCFRKKEEERKKMRNWIAQRPPWPALCQLFCVCAQRFSNKPFCGLPYYPNIQPLYLGHFQGIRRVGNKSSQGVYFHIEQWANKPLTYCPTAWWEVLHLGGLGLVRIARDQDLSAHVLAV